MAQMTGAMPGLVSTPRRRLIATAYLAMCLGVAALVWGVIITVIQLFYTIHYLQAIAAKQDVNSVMRLIPAWSRPYMVDLALVAPGLVSFTAACVIYGAWRALSPNAMFRSPETFPFPRRYRTYYIQHGLLGTVIGFVIGFWRLDVKSEQATTILLAALSAALWSTLTAIALAYFLCPIIEAVLQRCLLPAAYRPDADDSFLTLDKYASDAAEALARFTNAVESADATLTLRAVNEQLFEARRDLMALLQRADAADAHHRQLDEALKKCQSGNGELQSRIANVQAQLGAFQKELPALRSELEKTEAERTKESSEFKNRLQSLEANYERAKAHRRNEIAGLLKTGGTWLEQLQKSLGE